MSLTRQCHLQGHPGAFSCHAASPASTSNLSPLGTHSLRKRAELEIKMWIFVFERDESTKDDHKNLHSEPRILNSRKNLLAGRPTTSGGVGSGENNNKSKSEAVKKQPQGDTGSGQQLPPPKANKVVGDGTFDVFGRPMGVKANRSSSTPMPGSRVGEEEGGSAVGSEVKKGGGARRGAKDWSVKNVCDWLSSIEMGEKGEE